MLRSNYPVFNSVKASKSIFQTIEDYYNEFEGGNGPKRSGMLVPLVQWSPFSLTA